MWLIIVSLDWRSLSIPEDFFGQQSQIGDQIAIAEKSVAAKKNLVLLVVQRQTIWGVRSCLNHLELSVAEIDDVALD